MTYTHNGKEYTLDQLCEEQIVKAIRLYTLLSAQPAYYADTEATEGFPITEEQAVYLSEKYFADTGIEVV